MAGLGAAERLGIKAFEEAGRVENCAPTGRKRMWKQ